LMGTSLLPRFAYLDKHPQPVGALRANPRQPTTHIH
jgi:hypothetical protein